MWELRKFRNRVGEMEVPIRERELRLSAGVGGGRKEMERRLSDSNFMERDCRVGGKEIVFLEGRDGDSVSVSPCKETVRVERSL